MLWALGLAAVLTAIIVGLTGLDVKQRRAAARRQRDRELHLLAHYAVLMEEHEATLRLRVVQTAYQDPYGRWVMDKAFKELRYFFEHVLVAEIQPQSDAEFHLVKSLFDKWVRRLEEDEAPLPPAERPSGDGRDYERMVAARLAEAGFDVRFTPQSGDQGVDLIASHADQKIAIQCKDYSKPAGNDAVQQVYAGARFYQASRAIVVAPNDFTRSARQLASSLGVECLHHEQLGSLSGESKPTTGALS